LLINLTIYGNGEQLRLAEALRHGGGNAWPYSLTIAERIGGVL
jgi:hypothetical protein